MKYLVILAMVLSGCSSAATDLCAEGPYVEVTYTSYGVCTYKVTARTDCGIDAITMLDLGQETCMNLGLGCEAGIWAVSPGPYHTVVEGTCKSE